MLTPLGRQIRRLRIDKGVRLKDMADAFRVKSSFLSAVENGRKAPPETWPEKLNDYFQGFGVTLAKWRELAELSRRNVTIDLAEADEFDRETVMVFGRHFLDLPKERKQRIRRMLESD